MRVPTHFIDFPLHDSAGGRRLVNVAFIIDVIPALSGGCIVCLSTSPEDGNIHVAVDYDKLIRLLSHFSLVESF